MMKKFFVGWLVSVFVGPNFAIAHGVEIEEVTVVGRKVNLIGNATSASEGRISQTELSVRPILRSGEVLEVVPGMVATQHSGNGKANQYFLRGFNLDHGTDFATFIDSMPINMRSHGHGQGYTDLNFIIPELVAEVAYKKGSYYADVGDFSGTGSAQLQTVLDLTSNQFALGLGENHFGRALALGEVATSADHKLIYGFEHQVYDGPWEDISEDVGKTNLVLKYLWGNTNNQFSLNWMAYDNEWNSADQIPARAVAQGIISELGSLDTTLGGESSRYSLSGSWNKKSERNQFIAHVYAIRYTMDLWSNFTYFTSPDGDQFEQVDDRMIYGGDFSYSAQSNFLGKDLTNKFGVQTRIDDIDEIGLFRSSARQRTGVFRADAVQESSIGSYWENTLQWTHHVRSVLGVRYDYFNFDVDPLAAAEPSTLAQNAGTASDDIITSSLNLIYALNDNYESYVSIGKGFHSNDARGTTIQVDPNTGAAIAPVDPLVDTLGYEIGMRAFISDKLNASIALWHLDIDSELLFIGDEGTTEDTGVGSKRDGIETTVYYSFNPMFTFDLEYAYTDARLEQAVDGNDEIPGALQSVISAGVHIQFNEELYSHLRLREFSDYPLDGGETAAESTLFNLRVGYRLIKTLNVTLDILNVLNSKDHDVEYFYSSQLATEMMPVDDHHYHIFEPRSLRLAIAYEY
jgi:hypothetical protein